MEQLATEDPDAALVMQFEQSVTDTVQDDPDLAAFSQTTKRPASVSKKRFDREAAGPRPKAVHHPRVVENALG